MNSPGIFLIRWFNGLSSYEMRNERKNRPNCSATFVLAGKRGAERDLVNIQVRIGELFLLFLIFKP